MKKNGIPGAHLLPYCVPYAFLAIYADAENQSLLLYLVMVLGLGYLGFQALKAGEILPAVLGNLLSGAVSAICVEALQQESWRVYFAPMRTLSLVLMLTLGAVGLLLCIYFGLSARKLLRRNAQSSWHRDA